MCSCVLELVCRQFECSLCVSEGKENMSWGGLDVVFQSEWPAEENNKARMTGTDGLLYCPLKCKQWKSLLDVWHHYIFIFPLLSLSLLIALVAGTHPYLRLKCLIKTWSQMLIIGCLTFNGQRHSTQMTKGGSTVQAAELESTVRTRKCSKSNSTTLHHCLSVNTTCLKFYWSFSYQQNSSDLLQPGWGTFQVLDITILASFGGCCASSLLIWVEIWGLWMPSQKALSSFSCSLNHSKMVFFGKAGSIILPLREGH